MPTMRFAVCGSAMILGAVIGCGTLENVTGGPRDLDGFPLPGQGVRAYGGVRVYLDQIARSWHNAPSLQDDPKGGGPVVAGMEALVAACILAIDLPLTAIGDTLTLPYTLPVEEEHRRLDRPSKNLDAPTVTPTAASQPTLP